MTERDAPTHAFTRRPVLKLLTGGALTVVGIGVGVGRLSDSVERDLPSLQLSSDDGSGVQSLDIPLDSGRLDEVARGRWQTKKLPTSTHSMVALTWTRGPQLPDLSIRSRADGVWQEWTAMPLLHDVPDDGEDRGIAGTDLVWIGAADGIQVDVAGRRPADLTLVLLHPARLPETTRFAQRSGTSARTREKAPRPELRTRRDWDANEDWRSGSPSYNDTIRQVHVHHTVNSNDYSRTDVPGLLRGMYRYHTKSLGWSDIGYNFLIDRFGRIWVGRAGGARRPVRGAHTLGFNDTSCGVSVIGNFDTTKPNKRVIRSVAAVAAWKLDRYDRDPRGRIGVTSEGSDNYPTGRRVRLPVIDGHRDTNDTACPGRHLYDALPRIRRTAKRIVEAYPA